MSLESARSYTGGRRYVDGKQVTASMGGIVFDPAEDKTVQSQKDEADINEIMRRFGKTGQVPTNVRVPLSSNFVGIMDLQTALNAVKDATDSFMLMNADTRARFGNDPARFVEFCSAENPDGSLKNVHDMRKMGLAVPAEVVVEPDPVRVRVVPEEK